MSETLSIVYAEDDPDIQMIATIALKDIGGFEVHICNDGNEAIEKLNTIKPDLILLDVMMPKKDGPTALHELKQIHGSNLPPVVFITAKASSKEVDKLIELGAVGVITKPFDPMSLAQEVTALIQESRNGK
ncbi:MULTISPECIES: response regulator [Gammaproteobacteria]|uniref:response regulator n=1 Tax=Gammaproteobacteria TaxID=1236 RepID=UPI000DD0D3AB|nr:MULTISPECIES: response regulator [Gammaproteobacteria]RTE86583.1 response regulator [Aliidiomarina sp. B3213]TCZ90862.1 response regulator [Lysobacter sp. N42]